MPYKQTFESQITWLSPTSFVTPTLINKSSFQLSSYRFIINIHHWGFGEGGGKELWLESREGQELNAASAGNLLIFKISSDHHTVDHTNKLMGNDHDTIFV